MLSQLLNVHTKDPVPQEHRKGMVYKVTLVKLDGHCNIWWKSTKEYWQMVNLGCPHWLSIRWIINLTLLGEIQQLWMETPSCTNAKYFKHGTYAKSPDPSTETEGSYP